MSAPSAAAATAAAAAAAAAAPAPYHDETSGGTPTPSPSDQKAAAMLASPTNFTVASYLNLALQPSEDASADDDDDSRLQSRMAELALLLQVQTQTCHDEIGRIGAELRAILPRCKADVERLEQGLGGMADDASGLLRNVRGGSGVSSSSSGGASSGMSSNKLGKIISRPKTKGGKESSSSATAGHPTTPAVDTLSTLHSLRTNLRRTRHILSAASSWDATLSSIPGLLSTQNLSEAVTALSSLERGERALSGGMPGRTERREALTRIRGQIEVLLRPQLLHALNKMDTRLGPLQQCVSMYVQLDKIEALVEEYVRLRPSAIHKGWFSFVPPAPPPPPTATEEVGDDDDDDDDLGIGRGDEAASTDAATPSTSEAFAEAFLAWLPEWFGSVLTLISEERRRAAAVFGPKLAPDIVVRVLRECFRPILPSFRTRLSSLCPPDVDGGKHPSSSTWSLDAVCSAYEATLEFLSLSYEQLAGSFDASLSAAPSSGGQDGLPPSGAAASTAAGITSAKRPIEEYRLITSAFVFIASPFSPYQHDFAKLETKHCEVVFETVARDVQAAVAGRNVGSDLSSLQSAVDRLQAIGPTVFPLADDAVSRFELLNCGYNTDAAVATVDDLLAKHVGELAIAVSTLRTSMTADEDRLADIFDEEHVQCSLEILKVAGGMKRDLVMCEDKTRGVCREMLDRLEVYGDRYSSVHEDSNSGSSDPSFAVPDSLAAIDVAFAIAKATCGEENENPKYGEDHQSLASFARFLPGEKEGLARAVSLFPKATEAVTRLARTCHVFVFDVCSAVPRRALRDLPSLPIWRKEARTDALTYGILPQQYITAVGEHMLALVQAIEPFASDPEALALANNVMEGSKDVAFPSWRELAAAVGGGDANRDEIVAGLMNAQTLKDYVIQVDDSHDEGESEKLEDEEDADDLNATALFTNKWLDSIGLAVTGYLLERMLRVHHLSETGCEHMSADLNYLINVFEALGIVGHPHPLLVHFTRLLSMPADEMIMAADTSSAMARAIRASEMRIALMRGIESA